MSQRVHASVHTWITSKAHQQGIPTTDPTVSACIALIVVAAAVAKTAATHTVERTASWRVKWLGALFASLSHGPPVNEINRSIAGALQLTPSFPCTSNNRVSWVSLFKGLNRNLAQRDAKGSIIRET